MTLWRRPSDAVRRAVRFLVVAGTGTVCDVVVVLLARAGGLPLVAAVTAGWCTSLVVGFLLNRVWVFGDSPPAGRFVVAGRYGALSALNAAVAIFGVSGAVAHGVPYPVARVTASAGMTTINFFVCRHWVFRAVPAAPSAPRQTPPRADLLEPAPDAR